MCGWLMAMGLALTAQASAAPDLPESPAALVQRQVEAYNRHDAEAFAATYAENVELFDLGPDAGKPYLTGRTALLGEYQPMMTKYRPTAQIVTRTVIGNFVTDHERVTIPGNGTLETVAIYQVENGLIRRVWFAQ